MWGVAVWAQATDSDPESLGRVTSSIRNTKTADEFCSTAHDYAHVCGHVCRCIFRRSHFNGLLHDFFILSYALSSYESSGLAAVSRLFSNSSWRHTSREVANTSCCSTPSNRCIAHFLDNLVQLVKHRKINDDSIAVDFNQVMVVCKNDIPALNGIYLV